MNLGIARVVIVVALALAGIGLLSSGFPSTVTNAGPGGTSTSPTPTSPATTPSGTHTNAPVPDPNTSGVTFAVLNGTSVNGLAGTFETLLKSKDDIIGKPAADSPIKPITTTRVYFRGGADAAQNRSDARYLAKEFVNGPGVKAKISKLGAEFASTLTGAGDDKITLLIVLGQDYATAHPG